MTTRVVASPVATDEKEADIHDDMEKEEKTIDEMDPQHKFWYHCKRGDLDEIKALSQQIDINAVDREPNHIGYSSENTALHYAVESGVLQAVKMVFNLEAQIDSGNKLKSTPLHVAASFGYTEIVEYLLEKKANTGATNKIGNTPLHCAVYAGHVDTVKALLETADDPQKALLIPLNGIGISAVKYTAHDELKTYLKQFFPKKGDMDHAPTDIHEQNGLEMQPPPTYNANGNDVVEEEEDEGSADETTNLTGTGRGTATEQ